MDKKYDYLIVGAGLYGAVFAHIGANLITVLRTETGILHWMQENAAVYWISTVFMTLVCAGMIWVLKGNKQNGI